MPKCPRLKESGILGSPQTDMLYSYLIHSHTMSTSKENKRTSITANEAIEEQIRQARARHGITTRELLALGMRALEANQDYITEKFDKDERAKGRRHQKIVKLDPETDKLMTELSKVRNGLSRSFLAELAIRWMLEKEKPSKERTRSGNALLERTSDVELIAELERRGFDVSALRR